MLTKENVQDVYPLTPMQEGMLLDHARDPESLAYIEQFDFIMEGPLECAALRQAFTALVAKYDVLRTLFSFRKTDVPRQVVLKQRAIAIDELDLTRLDPSAAEAELERFKRAERSRTFNLSADLLMRISVVQLAPQRHHMVMTWHHIILDGWCFGPLLEDLFSFYERLRLAPEQPIEERESAPYGDYIRWLGQQDRARAYDYWSHALAGYQSEVGAPYFDLRYQGPVIGAEYQFQLGEGLSGQLAELARSERMTVNSLFQSAWGVLLQRYNNSDDVVFGTVVSGRPAALPGVERMVGLFINTQPLRVACLPQEPWIEVARRVHQGVFEAAAYEYYPLAAVQAASPLKNRLINHIVTFENLPLSEQLRQISATQAGGLRVTDVQVFQAAKFDFHVIVFPGADLRVSFVYNAGRYASATIESLARSLCRLLAACVEQPTRPVGELPICSADDRRQVLEQFNATGRPYPHQAAICDLFDQQAAARPEAVALRQGERLLRYGELRQQALALAGRMQQLGVQSGAVVALLAPRSVELVVATLASLYCGAAYLPLDTHASRERIAFMLQDGGVQLLCLHPDCQPLAPAAAQSLLLDTTAFSGPAASPTPLLAEQPAYVMYTSGSTGQPKGCVVSQRNVVRLVRNSDFLPFGPDLRILQTGSPAFDAATLEVWGALLNGGELVLVEEGTLLDARLLRAALERYAVNTLWLTSALFNQLCDADASLFAPLRHLLVGGDVLSPRHIERARAANPQLTLINGYGPTENTTFSATYTIDAPVAERIPIGRPIANSTAYVLDGHGELLPPGAYGELCVGGDGVAIGYLNRPELTQERFAADPFRAGGRLYRTGDIARWRPDGRLDLLGRNDFQVKIRGFRVELGEIESAIAAAHPTISDVVVVAHDSPGGKQLHAFYVAAAEIDPAALRASLSALPSYMVPSYYLRLERMPLTINGKLDRRALPIAESLARQVAPSVVEPRSGTEQRVAEICREVLGIDAIGIHDNFFEAGANSLNLIAINNRLKEAFSRDIPLAVLFEYTSVARLAEYLGADKAAEQARLAVEQEELESARQTVMQTRNLMRNLEEA